MVRKRKIPTFQRQHAHRKARVKKKGWRKPRGMYSKQREGIKSRGKVPTVGFQQPKAIRGRHPSGYYEVLVANVNDLDKIDPKTQAIKIRSTVGKKKAFEIAEKAAKLKIKLLNKPRPLKKKKKVEKKKEEPKKEEKKTEKKEVKKEEKPVEKKEEKPAEKKEEEKVEEKPKEEKKPEEAKPKAEQKKE